MKNRKKNPCIPRVLQPNNTKGKKKEIIKKRVGKSRKRPKVFTENENPEMYVEKNEKRRKPKPKIHNAPLPHPLPMS